MHRRYVSHDKSIFGKENIPIRNRRPSSPLLIPTLDQLVDRRGLRRNKRSYDYAYPMKHMNIHVPASNIAISGKVNTSGRMNRSPHTLEIGIDQTIALGSSTEGLWTSSAMLATEVGRNITRYLIMQGLVRTHTNG
jgi:hypothetical protein